MVLAGEIGTSWQRVDKGQGERFSSISWDGPLIVGVGTQGLLSTSTNGKIWTTRFQEIQTDLKAVVWSGSHYVAVGFKGAILRSANGIDWQRIVAPVDRDYSGVTWTGTQFIALDNFYYLSTSADGVTWNRLGLTSIPPALGIDYFDGAIYLKNSSGISRSTNQVVWTQVLELSYDNVPAMIRKWNGRLFAVGNLGAIYSSGDGISWTPGIMDGGSFGPNALRDIAWSGAGYVAIGMSNRVWHSEDGLSWKTENTFKGDPVYVRWINGEFVIGSPAGNFQTSSNGMEWTSYAFKGEAGNATVWGAGRYITVGDSGYIATSSDLDSWTTRRSNTFSNLLSVVAFDSIILASGTAGVILKSDDGLEWHQVASPP